MHWDIDNLRDGYVEILGAVRDHGAYTAPRGQATREVLNATITLRDPTDALPFGVGRKLNPAIGAAEALQLVGGFTDPALMVAVTKNFTRFMDGGILMGAYGPRIRTQLPEVERRLRDDPDTRQAIALIWDPTDDGFGRVPKDLPCTLGFQFLIRNGELVLLSKMRSQDCYLGLAYDLFMFAQLQLGLANVLGIPAGPLHHNASSFHIYERNFDQVEQLHPYREDDDFWSEVPRPQVRVPGIVPDAPTVDALQDKALSIWETPLVSTCEPWGAKTWYCDVLGPHIVRSRAS